MTTELNNVNPLTEGKAEKAPLGVYPATLESIIGVEKDNFEKTKKEMQAEFKFTVHAKGQAFTMWLNFFPSCNPKHKLYQFVSSMTGEAKRLPPGEEAINVYWTYLQSLVGNVYKVQVGLNKNGNPKILTAFSEEGLKAPVATSTHDYIGVGDEINF